MRHAFIKRCCLVSRMLSWSIGGLHRGPHPAVSTQGLLMIKDYPSAAADAAAAPRGLAAVTSSVLGREVLATAAAALLYPLGWWRPRRSSMRKAEQRTLVYIHGYAANSSCFAPLGAYLRIRGHKQTLAYNYRLGDSVEGAAIGLKAFLQKHVRGGRIDLVCHSLGGLVAMVYLCELGGARRVDRCITLGTPHRGTYNSYWVRGRMGRDLRPDSALLARLHAHRMRARRVVFTAVVAEADNIIIPRVLG